MTLRTRAKPKKMWAVCRDGEIYLIKPKKLHANHERDHYALGGVSKHQWTVRAVLVGETTNGSETK